MKSESDPQAKAIADLAAGCEGPNQFENFDRAFRATLTVPKAAVLKEEARLKRARAGKKAPQIARVPRERILEAGGDCMGQPAYFGVYLDVPPITEVVVKAKRILGFQPTPFDIGLRETYRWYLRNSKKSRIDYSFEDRLIEMASAAPAVD